MINHLIIEGSDRLPSVVLDAARGRFEIEGKAVCENADKFFSAVISWMEEYVKRPNAVTNFRFNLDYFNISSSQRILAILAILEDLHQAGHGVALDWYYAETNEDMYEVGRDFSAMFDLPFRFHEFVAAELKNAQPQPLTQLSGNTKHLLTSLS